MNTTKGPNIHRTTGKSVRERNPPNVWLEAKTGGYRGVCTPRGKRCPLLRIALAHENERHGIGVAAMMDGTHVTEAVVYRVAVTRTRSNIVLLNACPWCGGALGEA